MTIKSCVSTVLLAALTALTGCGGGGGGGGGASSPSGPSPAEGVWQGSTSGGDTATAVILENGEIWALFSGADGVQGFLQGSSTTSGSSVSGNLVGYNWSSRVVAPFAFTGTFASKSSLSFAGNGGNYNAVYVPDYDSAPASLSALAGSYTGWAVSASGGSNLAASVTVSPAGQLSAVGSACPITGSISPRSSGKNIYNVSVTSSGVGCGSAGQTYTGVGSYSASSDRMVIVVLNSARTDGFVFSAARQVPSSISGSTFQVRQAWNNYASTSATRSFTIAGKVNTTAVAGSGSATTGNIQAATFEGAVAQSRTTVVTGTILASANSTPYGSTTTGYFDSNYLPLGYTGAEYAKISGVTSIPQTSMVNDAGVLYTYTRYPSSAKAYSLGTTTVSYALTPDTSTTALLKIISVEKSASSAVQSTSILTFRMTPAGVLTPLKEELQNSTSALTVTY